MSRLFGRPTREVPTISRQRWTEAPQEPGQDLLLPPGEEELGLFAEDFPQHDEALPPPGQTVAPEPVDEPDQPEKPEAAEPARPAFLGPETTVDIVAYGDLHSTFLFHEGFFPERLSLSRPVPHRMLGRPALRGTLIEGSLEPPQPDLVQIISEGIGETERVLLAFGQVDLELGFYRRRMVDRERLPPEEMVRDVLDAHEALLDCLNLAGLDVVLKGVNLTALSPTNAAALFLGRRLYAQPKFNPVKARRELEPLMLTEDEQNEMHLSFNAGLAEIARSRGLGYFDLNDELCRDEAAADIAPRLDDQFRSGSFDMRLADTIVLRRMHYLGTARAFGLLR